MIQLPMIMVHYHYSGMKKALLMEYKKVFDKQNLRLKNGADLSICKDVPESRNYGYVSNPSSSCSKHGLAMCCNML